MSHGDNQKRTISLVVTPCSLCVLGVVQIQKTESSFHKVSGNLGLPTASSRPGVKRKIKHYIHLYISPKSAQLQREDKHTTEGKSYFVYRVRSYCIVYTIQHHCACTPPSQIQDLTIRHGYYKQVRVPQACCIVLCKRCHAAAWVQA